MKFKLLPFCTTENNEKRKEVQLRMSKDKSLVALVIDGKTLITIDGEDRTISVEIDNVHEVGLELPIWVKQNNHMV